MNLMKACVLTCVLTMMSTHAQGAVTLPAIWSSDMVLQQQSEARFGGKATPGADVTIVAQWQKTPLTVKAGADGRWSAKIKTPEGGKKNYTLEFTDGADGESLTLENIAIGEVWLCSGQSNMEMPVAGWGKVKDYEKEMARRLALLALNRTYGKDVVCSAPEYAGYTIVGNEIHIDFNATAADFSPTDGEIDGFIIAGHDGRFYKGVARREGDRIAVSSPEVEYPVAVRYCWADNPKIGLRGKTGLPVAPFRTDNR